MKYIKLFENKFEEEWDFEETEEPKKNDRYRVKYANSLGDLQSKALGYHHDHAHHVYFGRTDKLPEKLQIYANDQPYIFIFYEDIPYRRNG